MSNLISIYFSNHCIRQQLLKTTPYSVMWSGFHALDDTLLITAGRQHLYFWKLAWDPYRERQGRLLRDTRSGHFEVSQN